MLADWVPGEDSLPGFSLCPCGAGEERGRKLPHVSSNEGTNPIVGTPPL